MITRVIDLVLEDPLATAAIKKYNPDFVKPTKGAFLRMRYSEAIEWLREREILNEEGNPHTFGDDMYSTPLVHSQPTISDFMTVQKRQKGA
jgi:asparaginyl-tRNA synthetase